MEKKFPEDIIPEEEFPAFAFISFHGKDREEAESLAGLLLKDGIKAWYDKRDLKPGEVDKEIAGAVSRCPVFIPVISNTAQQMQADGAKSVKYHIREWEWAYGQYSQGQNPRLILPVKIDKTPWMYESFKKFAYLEIPGGKRTGDYEKLKSRLQEIIYNPHKLERQ